METGSFLMKGIEFLYVDMYNYEKITRVEEMT